MGSEPVGPHRFAADLAAVLEQLDLRDAVVVGHSLGGTVVGQLSADRADLVSERVAGLVFVGTFASAIAGEGRFRELFSPTMIRLAARFQTGTEPRERPTPDRSGLRHGPLAVRAPSAAGAGPVHPRPGAATPPAVMGGATVANIDYDVRDALGEIDRPSLVVRGAHDSLATERSVAQLEAALADPEVVIVEGCGHLPMLEDRARFAEVLAGFADAGHDAALTAGRRLGQTGPAPTSSPPR